MLKSATRQLGICEERKLKFRAADWVDLLQSSPRVGNIAKQLMKSKIGDARNGGKERCIAT